MAVASLMTAAALQPLVATGTEGYLMCSQSWSAGVQLVITRAKRQLIDIFRRTHFHEHLGEGHFFRTRTDAILYARAHLGDQEQAEPIPLLESESAFI